MRTKFDFSVDLHGLRFDEAELKIMTVIRTLDNRGRTVLFIHGNGNGVLKKLVRQLAENAPEVKEVWYGEEYNLAGFDGVTAVFL